MAVAVSSIARFWQPGRVRCSASFLTRSICLSANKSSSRVASVAPSGSSKGPNDTSPTSRSLPAGPDLAHFLQQSAGAPPGSRVEPGDPEYLDPEQWRGDGRRVYIEVYGCQMNWADAGVVRSILSEAGYQHTDSPADAHAVLLLTCSIRERAERRLMKRVRELHAALSAGEGGRVGGGRRLGVLGCMAERLKHRLFEETDGAVDVIVGPDSYRHLPRLLSTPSDRAAAMHVQLSLEETYADVRPTAVGGRWGATGLVSVMRGCDNMCTYCVVPFTRGRERTRPLESVVDEVRKMVEGGVREVTLLGQNVNSYRDLSAPLSSNVSSSGSGMSRGFHTVYKRREGGRRFADLLAAVSDIDPEVRVRFTSPHPKDFPDQLLQLIAERPNICSCLHLPAQAGSSRVLASMGRGYTREAYLELVELARATIPSLALTSDFIAGFCGETPAEFEETLSLIAAVRYNFCYLYAYSMREKTRAFHRLRDDVHDWEKTERRRRMTELCHSIQLEINRELLGQQQLVLIEDVSRKVAGGWYGRTDGFTKVIVLPDEAADSAQSVQFKVGDYVAVEVTDCTFDTLMARALRVTTLTEFSRQQQQQQYGQKVAL